MTDQNELDRDDQEQSELDRQEAEQRAEADAKAESERTDREKYKQDTDVDDDDNKGEKDKKDDGVPPELKKEMDRMREALKKANKEAEKYRHEAKPWRELNLEVEEVSKMQKEREDAEIRKAEERGEWETLREKQQEKHQREMQLKDEQLNIMRSTMESYLVDFQATDALSKKGVGEEAEILLPHIKAKVKPVQEGDRYEVRVVDDKGEPRVKDDGEFMSINDLVNEMQQSTIYGRVFPAPEKSGGGTQQGGQKDGGKRVPKKARLDMSAKEKQEFIGEHGIEEYNKLPMKGKK